MRPLSALKARGLLATARGDRLEALYALAVYTGMRRGELLALRWSDEVPNAISLSQELRDGLERGGGWFNLGPPD